MNSESGLTLVVVLWTVLLLGFMASNVLSSGRGDLQRATNLVKASRASLLVDGATAVAISALAEIVDDHPIKTDGSVYGWTIDGYNLFIRITPEAGRVDINNAPAQLLEKLVRATGVRQTNPSAVARAIVAYRKSGYSPDDQQAVASSNSPASLVSKEQLPFRSVEELLGVQGVTPELYQAMTPVVTVYSGRSTPDTRSAPALVRSAIAASVGRSIDSNSRTLSERGSLGAVPILISSGGGAQDRRFAIYRIETAAFGAAGHAAAKVSIVNMAIDSLVPYRLLSRRHSNWAMASGPTNRAGNDN